MFIRTEELWVVQQAEKIADDVWRVVEPWDVFRKRTVGEQLVRSCDSIGANLIEGSGRHVGPDALRFFYIARGSLKETSYWLRRVRERGLCDHCMSEELINRLENIAKALNAFIVSYKNKLKNKQLPTN